MSKRIDWADMKAAKIWGSGPVGADWHKKIARTLRKAYRRGMNFAVNHPETAYKIVSGEEWDDEDRKQFDGPAFLYSRSIRVQVLMNCTDALAAAGGGK